MSDKGRIAVMEKVVLTVLGSLPYPVLQVLIWLEGLVLRVCPGHYLWLVKKVKLI